MDIKFQNCHLPYSLTGIRCGLIMYIRYSYSAQLHVFFNKSFGNSIKFYFTSVIFMTLFLEINFTTYTLRCFPQLLWFFSFQFCPNLLIFLTLIYQCIFHDFCALKLRTRSIVIVTGNRQAVPHSSGLSRQVSLYICFVFIKLDIHVGVTQPI